MYTRTYLCVPDPLFFGFGSGHYWTVLSDDPPEEFPASVNTCPFHDGLPLNENPEYLDERIAQ